MGLSMMGLSRIRAVVLSAALSSLHEVYFVPQGGWFIGFSCVLKGFYVFTGHF